MKADPWEDHRQLDKVEDPRDEGSSRILLTSICTIRPAKSTMTSSHSEGRNCWSLQIRGTGCLKSMPFAGIRHQESQTVVDRRRRGRACQCAEQLSRW